MSSWAKVGNWTVENEDTRGLGVACLYCKAPLGQRHASTCVVPQKVVRIEWSVEFDVTVPDSWDRHAIEFHRNDSSWCADNGWRDLRDARRQESCFCGISRFRVVRMRGGAT